MVVRFNYFNLSFVSPQSPYTRKSDWTECKDYLQRGITIGYALMKGEMQQKTFTDEKNLYRLIDRSSKSQEH